MAHFAQLNSNNQVMGVIVVSDDVLLNNGDIEEQLGIDFCNTLIPGFDWKQTSYNTYGGVHKFGGVPLRKNYAGAGYTYDSERNAFIPPKPFPSWVLVERTCLWEAPVPRPEDGKIYLWDEATLNWVEDQP